MSRTAIASIVQYATRRPRTAAGLDLISISDAETIVAQASPSQLMCGRPQCSPSVHFKYARFMEDVPVSLNFIVVRLKVSWQVLTTLFVQDTVLFCSKTSQQQHSHGSCCNHGGSTSIHCSWQNSFVFGLHHARQAEQSQNFATAEFAKTVPFVSCSFIYSMMKTGATPAWHICISCNVSLHLA